MKFYSSETMRQHAQDLTKEIEVKQIPDALRYFIINMDKGSSSLPMYDMASKQSRGWTSSGVLDLHDLAQECYCALIRAYNRNPEIYGDTRASLWAYLKKSIKLDTRKAINTYKDGMRIPLDKIWEAGWEKNVKFEQDNFFSIPVDGWWLYVNDEVLDIVDDSKMTRWETEILHEGLQDVMRNKLTDTERQVMEMFYGMDEPFDKPKSQKDIANYFNQSITWVKTVKHRALKKLKNDEVKTYLENFVDISGL